VWFRYPEPDAIVKTIVDVASNIDDLMSGYILFRVLSPVEKT
jgi:hypothetical protein